MRKLARLTIIFFCLYLSGYASAGQEMFSVSTCKLIDAESLDPHLKRHIQEDYSFLRSPVRTSLRVSRIHTFVSRIVRCDCDDDDRVFFIIKVFDRNGTVVDRLSEDITVYQDIVFISPITPIEYDGTGVLLQYHEKGSVAYYWDELKSEIFSVTISE